MTNQKEEMVEQAKERLLDPFEPLFPLPGMWHFAFGFIFALVSFVGGVVLILGLTSFNPAIDIAIVSGTSLLTAILVILATKGFIFPSKILLVCSLLPIGIAGTTVASGNSVKSITFIFVAFSVAAFVLLMSTNCRALVNVMAIRRLKIKEMKKNGTYNKNLQTARERWQKH